MMKGRLLVNWLTSAQTRPIKVSNSNKDNKHSNYARNSSSSLFSSVAAAAPPPCRLHKRDFDRKILNIIEASRRESGGVPGPFFFHLLVVVVVVFVFGHHNHELN